MAGLLDFLVARRQGSAEGFNSRMGGVGSIETLDVYRADTGLREMMHTTAFILTTVFNEMVLYELLIVRGCV